MSTCEHQGRDTVLQTGVKIHWSRRSACSCFNRVWNVTISSAKHQSMLRPWVMQHQPWPRPSAWTKTRSLHGCRNFYLLILPSPLSLSLSLSLFFSLFLTGPTSVALSCVSSRLNFAPNRLFAGKNLILCSHNHTTVIAGLKCLNAHLLAPHDRAQSQEAVTSPRSDILPKPIA